MSKMYDVVVIGGGLAGYYSARTLRKGGKSVALIEKDVLGGTALISGALPIKKILDSFKNNRNSQDVLENWDKELKELNEKIEKNILDTGIDLYYGDGDFLDSKSYRINKEILEAQYFIIATGTEPASTKDFKIDGKNIISHKEVIDLKNMPKKVTVLGGNVEGVELAALYAEMGVEVALIEKEENILFENDRDLVEPIENHLKSLGVEIIRGLRAKSVEVEDKGLKIILENGQEILSDKAVNTFLRRPNFPKGIENTRIERDNNKILVDENLMTHEKNIFAIGDINGILGMGHVAIQQGLAVAYYILNNRKINIDYRVLPRAIFTIPEMAGVGSQEWELKRDKTLYKVGSYTFQDSWRGWANKTEGFVKVILDKDNLLLGVWMVGENVSEYIGLLGLALKENTRADDILSNLIIHPSLTEAILEATIQAKAFLI